MNWPALVWPLLKYEQTYRAKGLPYCFTMLKCDARNLNVSASDGRYTGVQRHR
jgi:hypothetical protein